LAAHLGDPTLSPTGKPIPSKAGEVDVFHSRTLADLGVGAQREIVHLESDPTSDPFFDSQGIQVGEFIRVSAIGSDGAMMISVGDRVITLDKSVAEHIFISDA